MGIEPNADPERNPFQIGIDREGGVHMYSKTENLIRVYNEKVKAEPVYEYDLDDIDKSVTAWVAYVGKKRGWEQRSFITAQDLYEGFQSFCENSPRSEPI